MSDPRRCPRCDATLPSGSPPELCPRCLMRLGLEGSPERSARAAPTAEELAPHFPQLEILEPLGRGGMGVVYKARQRELDRTVALKVLTVDPRQDPTFAERFAREARALASLAHPHIVAIHDSGRAGEHYYLLMEYVDGLDLRRLIEGGELESRAALELVSQISGALQYAHDEGVVHRDIKPENILVDRKGRAKIADFGLAKLLARDPADAALTGTHQAMGTWHYMAPEQIERPLEVDHRADIYSLGVVFYELLTGELPLGRFAAPSGKIRVDVRVDEVVLRTLEKEPARRYQHAGDVKTKVDEISSAPARPAARPTRRRRTPQEHGAGPGPAITGLVAVALAISGLGAVSLLALHRARSTWVVAEPPAYAGVFGVVLLGAGALLFLGLFAVGVAVLLRHARGVWPWAVAGALALSSFGAVVLAAFLYTQRGTIRYTRGMPAGTPEYPTTLPVGADHLAWVLLPWGLLLLATLAIGLIGALRRRRTS